MLIVKFATCSPEPCPAEKHQARNVGEFERIARSFARSLQPGDVVALSGALGAGKTTFVAAALSELQGGAPVSSPTFLFWQRYPGPPPVEHLDFYRIEQTGDARELGLHEALESGNIVFVEWPERLPNLIPKSSFRVGIAGRGSEPREITIEAPR